MVFLDPKTELIMNIIIKKILQRLPLSICMTLSFTVLTYVVIFNEVFTSSIFIIFILVFFIALITSFAFEYDTKDEVMSLTNIGASPFDIFKLSMLRIWTLSFFGSLIGIIFAMLFPIGQISNTMIFYAFILSNGLGVITSLYSAIRAMNIGLLERISFRSLSEKEAPIILYGNELTLLKNYIEAKLKERIDIIILDISSRENIIEIKCRYLGSFGRETFRMLTSLGINPDKSLREDESLPIIEAKISITNEGRPIIDCWEGKGKKSLISYSFQALIQQLIIEYKIYSGKIRGIEL